MITLTAVTNKNQRALEVIINSDHQQTLTEGQKTTRALTLTDFFNKDSGELLTDRHLLLTSQMLLGDLHLFRTTPLSELPSFG